MTYNIFKVLVYLYIMDQKLYRRMQRRELIKLADTPFSVIIQDAFDTLTKELDGDPQKLKELVEYHSKKILSYWSYKQSIYRQQQRKDLLTKDDQGELCCVIDDETLYLTLKEGDFLYLTITRKTSSEEASIDFVAGARSKQPIFGLYIGSRESAPTVHVSTPPDPYESISYNGVSALHYKAVFASSGLISQIERRRLLPYKSHPITQIIRDSHIINFPVL